MKNMVLWGLLRKEKESLQRLNRRGSVVASRIAPKQSPERREKMRYGDCFGRSEDPRKDAI